MYRESKARGARQQPLSSSLKVDLVESRSRLASSNPSFKVDLVESRFVESRSR